MQTALHAQDRQEFKEVPVEIIVDKIRGGLLGQILGNLNGLPHEMRHIEDPYEVKNYLPSLPQGAWSDDDTDFEWVYVLEMQKRREAFLSADVITELWKERINKRIWSSNRFARHLMDIGIKPPYTGYTTFNPWAEFNVSGQFLCETFGLIAPGMPQFAARMALNYTTVTINNEPAQTTQLFTGMIATAFVKEDMDAILNAGIAQLDKSSDIFKIVENARLWHRQYPEDWMKARQLLRDTYTQEGGRIRDFNGHELNTGAIILSLLYGEGDFIETLKLAFGMGWDADCNAATVGTIVGVMKGYRNMLSDNNSYSQAWQIVDRYKNVTRDNMPDNETITSFADRIIELFEMVNEAQGGSKILQNKVMVYQIPVELPAPVLPIYSIAEQRHSLQVEFAQSIEDDIVHGDRVARSRSAYLAICLDLDADLSQKYKKEWKQACSDLSGYWKIMNNIFFGDFEGLTQFRKKFQSAGFVSLPVRFEDDQLYNDRSVWKDPMDLYH
jgi:ADP-ribosylglycohydrolase